MTDEDKQIIMGEFQSRLQEKRNAISSDDCTWPKEQFDTYKEGMLQGFMWATEILGEILREG